MSDIIKNLKFLSSEYEAGDHVDISAQNYFQDALAEIERLRGEIATFKEVVEIQTVNPLRERIEELERNLSTERAQGFFDCLKWVHDAWGGIDSDVIRDKMEEYDRKSRYGSSVHIITDEQIRKALEYIQYIDQQSSDNGWIKRTLEEVLKHCNIMPCSECGGSGGFLGNVLKHTNWHDCPTCHGHKWVREEAT